MRIIYLHILSIFSKDYKIRINIIKDLHARTTSIKFLLIIIIWINYM